MNLDGLFPTIPRHVLDQLPTTRGSFQLTNPLRLAHFLAQCSHESGGFVFTRENLNYSASRLEKIFPKYFNKHNSKLYARNQEAIANKVYGNRMGNVEITDGWKFRGRGYIQLTGKANYAELDRFVVEDLLENPDLVASKYALLSAGFYWDKRKINAIADKGATKEIVREVTIKVNGGTHGLEDREARFFAIHKILTAPTV